MSRPTVTLNPGADRYHGPHERIIEFFDAELQVGGLIAFRRGEDGKLRVEPYRMDDDVLVLVEPRRGAELPPGQDERSDPATFGGTSPLAPHGDCTCRPTPTITVHEDDCPVALGGTITAPAPEGTGGLPTATDR